MKLALNDTLIERVALLSGGAFWYTQAGGGAEALVILAAAGVGITASNSKIALDAFFTQKPGNKRTFKRIQKQVGRKLRDALIVSNLPLSQVNKSLEAIEGLIWVVWPKTPSALAEAAANPEGIIEYLIGKIISKSEISLFGGAVDSEVFETVARIIVQEALEVCFANSREIEKLGIVMDAKSLQLMSVLCEKIEVLQDELSRKDSADKSAHQKIATDLSSAVSVIVSSIEQQTAASDALEARVRILEYSNSSLEHTRTIRNRATARTGQGTENSNFSEHEVRCIDEVISTAESLKTTRALASRMFIDGFTNEAISTLESAANRSDIVVDELSELYTDLSIMLSASDRRKAIDSSSRALSLNGENERALISKLAISVSMFNDQEAKEIQQRLGKMTGVKKGLLSEASLHISRLHINQGSFSEAEAAIDIDLNRNKGDEIRAHVHLHTALFKHGLGDDQTAMAAIKDAIRDFGIIGHPYGLSESYLVEGMIFRGMKNGGESRTATETALRFARKYGQTDIEAKALGNLGILSYRQNHLSRAGQLWEQSREKARLINDDLVYARQTANLALIARKLENGEKAIRLTKESIEVARRINATELLSNQLGNLAYIHIQSNRPIEARLFIKEAYEMKRASGTLNTESGRLTLEYYERAFFEKPRQ